MNFTPNSDEAPDFDGEITAGAQVPVTLVLGPNERITATVPAEASSPTSRALTRLHCPVDSATHRCHAVVEAPHLGEIAVSSATNTSCRTARTVMRSVARWANSNRCYETLCSRKHRLNRGFRCTGELVGEAAWQITCIRHDHIVRGFAAD